MWLSQDGGLSFQPAPLTLAANGGTVPTTTIEAEIAPDSPLGTISGQITDTSTAATEQDVTVSGMVELAPTPTITLSTTTLNLGTATLGTAGTPQSYTVSGSNLTGNIIIEPPFDVWLSQDGGTSFQGLLILQPTGGTVTATTIEAEISSYAPQGPIGARITVTSTGATEQDVAVSGMVNFPSDPGQLREQYGFHFGGSFYQNYLGLGEKWLLDRQGLWYVLTPDGRLSKWSGGSDLIQVGALDPSIFTNMQLLFQAPASLSQQGADVAGPSGTGERLPL